MPELLAEFRTLHQHVHRIVSSNKILGLDLVNHVWAKSCLLRKELGILVAYLTFGSHFGLGQNVTQAWPFLGVSLVSHVWSCQGTWAKCDLLLSLASFPKLALSPWMSRLAKRVVRAKRDMILLWWRLGEPWKVTFGPSVRLGSNVTHVWPWELGELDGTLE
ncbi:hypothetical protein PIB30_086767 [Stylosanthes scabra]|uniref:Uncharacterized protein n=1 Tax=Stylosanthes scabra TaxID=79078 RepID=A0ABU6YS61_9FABA|nr:hypothetical protein [Stylosanthes scabra]